jgi:hypothetical protein
MLRREAEASLFKSWGLYVLRIHWHDRLPLFFDKHVGGRSMPYPFPASHLSSYSTGWSGDCLAFPLLTNNFVPLDSCLREYSDISLGVCRAEKQMH